MKPELKTVAVSGGIGSGKSTVCDFFREMGARVFNADETAKRLMESDAELRSEIVDAFGAMSFHDDGSLNRSFLARTIFRSPASRLEMNRLVHPRVAQAFRTTRREAQLDGIPLLVHESALITEVADRDEFDAIVIVESPMSLRLARVTERDDTTMGAVSERIASQPSPEEYRRVADYIVVNDGSLDQLKDRVETVFASIIGELPPAAGLDVDGQSSN